MGGGDVLHFPMYAGLHDFDLTTCVNFFGIITVLDQKKCINMVSSLTQKPSMVGPIKGDFKPNKIDPIIG